GAVRGARARGDAGGAGGGVAEDAGGCGIERRWRMSDPVRPATWEEVERLRQCYARPPDAAHFTGLLVCLGPHLLALIDQMADLLHDARQEPGYLLGRAEERREVLEVIEVHRREFNRPAPMIQTGDYCDSWSATGSRLTCDTLRKAIASRNAPAWTPPPAV